MIYAVIILFFLALSLRYDFGNKKGNNKFFFVLEAIILICFFGLRYRVGADSLNYEEKWDAYPHLSDLADLGAFAYLENQPLYYVFVGLVKEINDSFVAFQIVHAIIVNTVFFITIKRYSTHKYMAVLFYFVFMSLTSNTEILRESLAVSAFMLSLPYLIGKRWIKYYCFTALAIGFHISALICLIFPFVFKFLEKRWKISQLFVVLMALFVFSVIFKSYFSQLPLDLLNETNQEKLIMYSSSAGKNNIFGYIGFVYNCSFLLFIAYVLRKANINNELFNVAINAKFLFCVCSLILPIMANRLGGYFDLLYYILLAELVCSHKRFRNPLKAYILMIFALLLLNHINSLRSVDTWSDGTEPLYKRYAPYHSVFDKQKERDREKLLR